MARHGAIPTEAKDPTLLPRIRALLAEGHSVRQVGLRLGLRATLVAAICRRNGLVLPDARRTVDAPPLQSRMCLRCDAPFGSTGPHHRLCADCRRAV